MQPAPASPVVEVAQPEPSPPASATVAEAGDPGATRATTDPDPEKSAPPASSAPPDTPPTPTTPAARETFGAKHLVVMYQGSRRAPPSVTRSKEQARARATLAAKKARQKGVAFEDMVAEFSDEPGAAQRGGDLGEFPRGAMVPEFQEAVERLAIGKPSDVVETPFGFHVILRLK